ncbi:MAG: ABC transporter permease [Candidatus Muiribacteriota bacterium]
MIKYNLLKNFFKLNFKLKYTGSRLGIIWSFINPFVSLIIFTIVFEHILSIELENFPLYFFSGIIMWGLFAANVNNSCFAFLRHFEIIQKIRFDYRPLLISEIGVNTIIFLLNLLILFIFAVFFGQTFSLYQFLIHFPLIIIHVYLLSYSIGLIIGTANVFVRDTPHATEIILNVWFYASPVFYIPDMIPDKLLDFLVLNPMFYSMLAFRRIFYNPEFGEIIIWKSFGYGTLIILFLYIISQIYYWKNEKWFPEKI